jgi:hypothetical protein
MRILHRHIERRVVVESYARYDCSKKRLPIPDFSRWNWSQANEIDKAMASAQLKTGVPAGYVLWDKVELTFSDLRESAVVADIFPNQSRKLVLCLINNFTITGMGSILAVPCGTWRIRCPFRLSNDGRWRRGLPLVTRHRRWSSDHAWCCWPPRAWPTEESPKT